MGRYVRGDVLLTSVALDSRTVKKTRPVIVVAIADDGTVHVCPVSSKPPSDAPCLPLCLDDFAQGGLDLFSESFVMTSRVATIRTGEVIGKKGRITADYLEEIAERIPSALLPGTLENQKTARRKHR